MIGQSLMTLDAMMKDLQLVQLPEIWTRRWPIARERYTTDGAAFLTGTTLDEIMRICRFPEEITQPLGEAVACIRDTPALAHLAWLWHTVLLNSDDHPEYGFADWPLPEDVMGDQASMFPAIVVLTAFPHLFILHRRRNIPEDVTRATCSDLAIWMRHYRKNTGKWGFAQLPWMMRHCRGELVRLGRLQFESIPYRGDVRVFKHHVSGAVLALSEAGVTYRRDGFVDGTNNIFDEQAWISEFACVDGVYYGHPISPSGTVKQDKIMLPVNEWAQKLAPGDQVWNIHIPEDGKMAHDLCGDALRQASSFFPQHFPELPVAAAFVTFTWLLDAQLQQLLPASSNIVRFQREFYLSPCLSYQEETFRRVFGSMPEDLTQAPRETSLERAVLDFTLAGNALRCACGFILCEDLDWGTARYQCAFERQSPGVIS